MGQGTSEAVARVEETRARLDAEVAELQRRLPPMVDRAKRRAGVGAGTLAGVAVAVIGIRFVVTRRRRRRVGKAVQLLQSLPLPESLEGAVGKVTSKLAG